MARFSGKIIRNIGNYDLNEIKKTSIDLYFNIYEKTSDIDNLSNVAEAKLTISAQ